ncbi:MAG: hypothetical protein AAB804_02855 [Patescibacteria group bacterium]
MAETGIPTSFIPHDTGVAPAARRGGGGLNDLLLLCAIVLFVASAALGAGVFLYEQYLQTESASKLAQLERAKAAFEPALIHELTRLDDRMHAADRILGAHVAPTLFFLALQQATLATISFRSLDLQAPDAQHMTITMAGVAQSVNSIALQADIFSKNGVITSPIFSNIARQADGVHFNLSAAVNPVAIGYVGRIADTGAAPQNPVLGPEGAAAQQTSEISPFGGAGAAPEAAPSQN